MSNSEPQTPGNLSSAHPPAESKVESAAIQNPKSYRFEDLAAGAGQICIDYKGKHYVLRRTRTGGLILNKQ